MHRAPPILASSFPGQFAGGEIARGVLRNPGAGLTAVELSGSGPDDPDRPLLPQPRLRCRLSLIADQTPGFWLQLHSTGKVTLNRLSGNVVIASAPVPAWFDGKARHTFEMTLQGATFQAALDGAMVRFDRGTTISLPLEPGSQGGAGIGFGVEGGLAGGQTVDNLIVTTPRPLLQ
jgi:hypothetical protein